MPQPLSCTTIIASLPRVPTDTVTVPSWSTLSSALVIKLSITCLSSGGQTSAMTGSPRRALEALQALLAAGIEPADFSMGSPSLDEVFFALTGKERVAEEAQ